MSPLTIDARALFDRHLDLRPLRGRRRGVTHCPFHGEDRHPSLSVDLDAGVFNCFACGARGGVKHFRELVGEAPTYQSPRGAAPPAETDAQRAWREAVRRGQAEYARRGAWLPWLFANGTVCVLTTAARRARRTATALGPDHPRTWAILEHAARVEREALTAEAQLDALLEGGRLHCDSADAVAPILAVVAGGRR